MCSRLDWHWINKGGGSVKRLPGHCWRPLQTWSGSGWEADRGCPKLWWQVPSTWHVLSGDMHLPVLDPKWFWIPQGLSSYAVWHPHSGELVRSGYQDISRMDKFRVYANWTESCLVSQYVALSLASQDHFITSSSNCGSLVLCNSRSSSSGSDSYAESYTWHSGLNASTCLIRNTSKSVQAFKSSSTLSSRMARFPWISMRFRVAEQLDAIVCISGRGIQNLSGPGTMCLHRVPGLSRTAQRKMTSFGQPWTNTHSIWWSSPQLLYLSNPSAIEIRSCRHHQPRGGPSGVHLLWSKVIRGLSPLSRRTVMIS